MNELSKDTSDIGPEEEEIKEIEISFNSQDGYPCFVQIPTLNNLIQEIEHLTNKLKIAERDIFELKKNLAPQFAQPPTPKLKPRKIFRK